MRRWETADDFRRSTHERIEMVGDLKLKKLDLSGLQLSELPQSVLRPRSAIARYTGIESELGDWRRLRGDPLPVREGTERPGDGDAEIRRRLEDADIFMFVASAAAMIRPYIRDPELRRARERHAAGELEVVTAKLEPCACDEDPFLAPLQRLAPRFKSIAEARIKSEAWEQIRQDLLAVIGRVRERKRSRRGGASA